MPRFAQAGIIIGAFGIVLAFMGLFPGVTGVEPTIGVGIIQVAMLMAGYSLLTIGALMYAKYTYYTESPPTLAQQIGVRVAITGLLFATIAGLADIVGFGSHTRTDISDIFFGQWQAFGVLGFFAMTSIGVMIYAVTGNTSTQNDGNTEDAVAEENNEEGSDQISSAVDPSQIESNEKELDLV